FISTPGLLAFLYHGKVRAHCTHRRLLVASVGWHGGPADVRRPLSLSLDRPRSAESRRRSGRVSGRLGRRELEAEPQPNRGAAPARSRTDRSHGRRAARPLARVVAGRPKAASSCAVHPWPASCAGSTTSTMGRDTSTAATTTCSWSRRQVATPSS